MLPRPPGGDYATAQRRGAVSPIEDLPNERLSPLFQAVVEATEEAVLNSLFAAETMEGNGRRIEALPVDEVLRLYRRERGGQARQGE